MTPAARGRSSGGRQDGGSDPGELLRRETATAFKLGDPLSDNGRDHRSCNVGLPQAVGLPQEPKIADEVVIHYP
jgi:hypothetical protein